MDLEDRRVGLGGNKPRVLLAALLAHRNRVVSTERLIDTLWGDQVPPTAHKSVQKFVSALRKELGEIIVTREPGYLLVVAEDELDAARLESAVREARRLVAGWDERLHTELASWRGDPYPEIASTDWGAIESARLVDLKLEAEELIAERRMEVGNFGDVVAHLEALVSQHPFRERLWALLMIALYRSGRQAAALDAYRRLRTTLGEGLGIDPSSELSRLEERILLHDPELIPQAAALRHNLPAPVTTFIGRGAELGAVIDLLSARRLVTLLGSAGSGKTRLAIEVGRSVLGKFAEHGVWFVDLATVRSPDLVIDAIGRPLGVGSLADRPAEEVLADYLARHRLLLILDNCEHLVARIAAVAERLLRASPTLVVLATSRERLGIDGEVIFDVSPLPYPTESESVTEDFDAVRLFLDRAGAVSRSFELASSHGVIGEIVRRLDGIPLALELAAARVRTLGLSELRDRLDNRFELLISPSRSPLGRHQTLQAAVDWSYRLLDRQEQALFRRLSVFRGGFDLAAASQVCGFEPLAAETIPGLVAELVDKSLVSLAPPVEGRHRYLLLETIREFGQIALTPSESGRLRQAHAQYFCQFAESAARHITGPDQRSWLATLEADHDNLRKALRWGATSSPETAVRLAVALARFWDSVGPRSEGLEWLSRAVELSTNLEPKLRISALVQASDIFSSQHASLPRDYAELALAEARETGDKFGEGRALRALSWALTLDGRIDEACEAGLEAQGIFAEQDDPWELALWMERMGQGSFTDPDWSIGMLTQALELYRQVGDRSREALVLYKIAEQIAGKSGDLDVALDYAQQAIDICEELGNVHDGAHAKLEFGRILRRIGDFEKAEAFLRDALAELTNQGDARCSVRTLTALGTTLIDAGDYANGEDALRESLRLGLDLGERRTARSALAGLARVMIEAEKAEDGVALLSFVEELGRQLDIPVSERSQEKRDAQLTTLRSRLGREEFDRHRARGRSMPLEDAVDLALRSTPAPAR